MKTKLLQMFLALGLCLGSCSAWADLESDWDWAYLESDKAKQLHALEYMWYTDGADIAGPLSLLTFGLVDWHGSFLRDKAIKDKQIQQARDLIHKIVHNPGEVSGEVLNDNSYYYGALRCEISPSDLAPKDSPDIPRTILMYAMMARVRTSEILGILEHPDINLRIVDVKGRDTFWYWKHYGKRYPRGERRKVRSKMDQILPQQEGAFVSACKRLLGLKS